MIEERKKVVFGRMGNKRMDERKVGRRSKVWKDRKGRRGGKK